MTKPTKPQNGTPNNAGALLTPQCTRACRLVFEWHDTQKGHLRLEHHVDDTGGSYTLFVGSRTIGFEEDGTWTYAETGFRVTPQGTEKIARYGTECAECASMGVDNEKISCLDRVPAQTGPERECDPLHQSGLYDC